MIVCIVMIVCDGFVILFGEFNGDWCVDVVSFLSMFSVCCVCDELMKMCE